MIVQVVTVAINIVLAPILIFGWGTGVAFGVEGAAIASLVAIVVGVAWLTRAVPAEPDAFLRFTRRRRAAPAGGVGPAPRHRPAGRRRVRPDGRLHVPGLVVARPFGSPRPRPASASGCAWCRRCSCRWSRSAFSAAPVAGQNVGARRFDRVRQTLFAALGLAVGLMLIVAVVCPVRRRGAGRRLLGRSRRHRRRRRLPADHRPGASRARASSSSARASSRRSAGRCRRC